MMSGRRAGTLAAVVLTAIGCAVVVVLLAVDAQKVQPPQPVERHWNSDGESGERLPEIGDDGGQHSAVDSATGRVLVRVHDASGTPIPNATVERFQEQQIGQDRSQWADVWRRLGTIGSLRPEQSVQTAEDGEATLRNVDPGKWTIVVRKPGYARTGRADVLVTATRLFAEVDIRMRVGHSLSGRVLDPHGTPLIGAVVVARPVVNERPLLSADSRISRARSGVRGRFRVEGLTRGDVALSVSVEGAPPCPVLRIRVPEVSAIDLVVPLGGVLTGRVVDEESGDTLPGRGLRVARMSDGIWIAEARTDGSGRFRLSPLPGNNPQVLELTGDRWQVVKGGRLGFQVPFGDEVEHDVLARRSEPKRRTTSTVTIRGQVVDQHGNPCDGVRVSARGDGTETGVDGTFELSVPRRPELGSDVAISSRRAGWAVQERVRVALTSGADDHEVLVTMVPAPVLVGRVSSASGRELENAWVRVRLLRKKGGRERGRATSGKIAVEGRGRFRTELPVAFGFAIVEASADRHGKATSEPVELRPQVAEYRVNVEVPEGSTVRGRVVEADSGVAIEGARIVTSRSPAVIAVSDVEGRFEARGLDPGPIVVGAEIEGRTRAEEQLDLPARDQVVVLRLDEVGSIEGRVEFPNGDPVVGCDLWLNSERERNIAHTRSIGSGRFEFGGLATGRYTITVVGTREANVLGRTTRDLLAGSGTEVRVVVERSGAVRGRVVDGEGDPVERCRVSAVSTSGGSSRSARTSADGTFTVVGLVPGKRYDVTASDASHQPATVPNVAVGMVDLEIVLADETLEISGRVVDQGGNAVQGSTLCYELVMTASGGRPRESILQRGVALSDEGAFRIGGLVTGRYRISLDTSGEVRPLRGGDAVLAGSDGVVLVAE